MYEYDLIRMIFFTIFKTVWGKLGSAGKCHVIKIRLERRDATRRKIK